MTATAQTTPAEEPAIARKPRVMIAGEFSAGKSRLINGLLGKEVLPSNVTSTALPPIWLIHGIETALMIDLDGNSRPLDFEDIQVETTSYCLLSCEADILKYVDLIDTPGNSDPNIPPICWERIVEYADNLVWCSSAMQAWKQTEKATCKELPEDLLASATLLITQADRMPDEKSAEKVLRRVSRDASKLFPEILMGSMLNDDDVGKVRDRLISLAETMPLRGSDVELVEDARMEAEAKLSGNKRRRPVTQIKTPVKSRPAPFDATSGVRPKSKLLDDGEKVVGPWSMESEEETAKPTSKPIDAETDAKPEAAKAEDKKPAATKTDAKADVAEETAAAKAEKPKAVAPSKPKAKATKKLEPTLKAVLADTKVDENKGTSFGLPNGVIAELWKRKTDGLDLDNNEQFLSAVAGILAEVQGALKTDAKSSK